jgi:hypothetical protein
VLRIVLGFLLLIGAGAEARDVGSPVPPNIYNLSTRDSATPGSDFYDTTGKFRIYPTIDASTGIFVTIGQSKIASNSSAPATPYSPTNGSKCINLNPYDGFYYIANDPQLGSSASAGFLQSGWQARLCDKLIAAGKYTQVILIPIAIAGSSVLDWDTGGVYHDRIRAATALLNAMNITPTGWLWQQGTTDCANSMSQTTYQTTLRSVISYERSFSGRSSDKWMIAEDTIQGTGNTVCSGIEAAQTAVAGDTGNLTGPNADTLGFSTYTDGTHYNNTGNDAIAGLWSTKIQAGF